MKKWKILACLCFFFIQKSYGQETLSKHANLFRQINIAFEKFINDDRKNSDSNLVICNLFNDLVVKGEINTASHADLVSRKKIIEFFAYCILKSQDYKLIITAKAQKQLFDSLVDNINIIPASKENNIYKYALLGFYFENVERKYVKAEGFYKEAFDAGIAYPALLSWRSWNYLRSNGGIVSEDINKDSAKIWLAKCLQLRPEYANAYVCLGHFAGDDGNIQEAYFLFYKSLRLDPDLKTGHIAIAYWYQKRDMLDSAVDYYEKSIVKYPRFIRAMLNLVDIYATQKNTFSYNRQIEIYKKCISVDSLDYTYYEKIAEIFKNNLHNNDSAGYYYKKTVSLNYNKVYLLGTFYYYEKKDYKAAVKYFKEYSEINPSALLYFLIGQCNKNIGGSKYNFSEAILNFNKSVTLDSLYESSYEQLGLLYNEQSIYDSAIYCYNKLIKIKKKQSEAPNAKINKEIQNLIINVGFPYRNYAYNKMKIDSNYEAYKILLDCSLENNNRGCKIMVNALQNEFGFGNSKIDYNQAKIYYLDAAKLWPFCKLGIDGILRLYEKGNITMDDSTDYNTWKKMDTALSKSIYWKIKPKLYQEANKERGENEITNTDLDSISLRIWGSYPEDIHPLKWERYRIRTDYNLDITKKDYEEMGNKYLKAQDEGNIFTVSFQQNAFAKDNLKAKQLSVKEKLKGGIMTYEDVMVSGYSEEHFEAANYFADSWNRDSLSKSFTLYKLIDIKREGKPEYANNYLDAIAKFYDLTIDERNIPQIKNLDTVFDVSSYNVVEKLFLKWRMRLIDKETNFNDSLNKYIKELAIKGYWSDMMYFAKKYRSITYDEGNPNKATLVFAAKKAIDLYSYIYKNIPPSEKDYADILKLIAERCGGFSYTILLLKDYSNGLKAALLATAADANDPYAKTNLPIAYVLTGDYNKGKALYLEYKDNKFIDGRSFKEVFLEDIDDLKKKGIPIGRLEEIKILLNQN